MNISLLSKRWWKLDNENGLWQKIVKFKYLKNSSICTVRHRQNDSPIWSDLLKIRNIYLQGRRMEKETLFWKDIWLYDQPLYILYPDLFAMCQKPDLTVFQVIADIHSVTFSRWLVDMWKENWDQIVHDIANVHLSDGVDVVKWKFGSKGHFSVKSVYNALTVNDSGPYHAKIWKGNIPAKIKIFLWLILNNAILTKDNMVKRKWQGDPSCYFCNPHESANHLLFQCSVAKAVWAIVATSLGADNIPRNLEQCWSWCEQWLPLGETFHTMGIAAVCWALWKTRNKTCFEGKTVHDPASIVCYACTLMSYWAGLFADDDKVALEAGINVLLQIALKLTKKRKQVDGDQNLLQGPQDGSEAP